MELGSVRRMDVAIIKRKNMTNWKENSSFCCFFIHIDAARKLNKSSCKSFLKIQVFLFLDFIFNVLCSYRPNNFRLSFYSMKICFVVVVVKKCCWENSESKCEEVNEILQKEKPVAWFRWTKERGKFTSRSHTHKNKNKIASFDLIPVFTRWVSWLWRTASNKEPAMWRGRADNTCRICWRTRLCCLLIL